MTKSSAPQDLDAEARALLADPRWQRLRAHVDAGETALGAQRGADAALRPWRRLLAWLSKPKLRGLGIGALALAGVVLVVARSRHGTETGAPGGEPGTDRDVPPRAATVTLLCGDRELEAPLRCRVGEELSVSTSDPGGGHDQASLTLTPGPSGAAVDRFTLVVRGKQADTPPIRLARPGPIQILVTWTRAAGGAPDATAARELEVTP